MDESGETIDFGGKRIFFRRVTQQTEAAATDLGAPAAPPEGPRTVHLTWPRLIDTIDEMPSIALRAKQKPAESGGYRSAPAFRLAGFCFVAWVTASFATAQTSTPRRTVWDGVYTEGQA